jgi:heterotetrameric sarcosine oxidase gamma subunit
VVNAATSNALARSPFQGHGVGKRPNAAGQIGVHLTAAALPSVTLISTWISGMERLLLALGHVFGANVPQRVGQTLHTEFGLLMRTGPEEFLLVGDYASDRCSMLRASIDAHTGAVTDLSHARCRVRMDGPQCRTVLNKLFALDLRTTALPIEHIALTGTHHVPSLLHRLGPDNFDLYVLSTYAFDQLSTLLDAAMEYGLELEA